MSLQRTRNQAEQTARKAVIGMVQLRAQVEADQRAVENSQQAFHGEQLRLTNGISTPYRVILAGRDLTAAQFVLIQAQVSFAKALIALELAEGTILKKTESTSIVRFREAFGKLPGRREVGRAATGVRLPRITALRVWWNGGYSSNVEAWQSTEELKRCILYYGFR